jgi:hypothetical protein
MTIRSYSNAFEVVDQTEALNLIPNTWGLVNELGLFGEESITQNAVTFEQTEGTISVIGDKIRGERSTVNKEDNRKVHAYVTTHHPLDDYLGPQDLAGRRAYGSVDQAETEAAAMARKLARIRMNHAITLEKARCHTLVTGTQFAPNGTVSANFYTDFGVTRKSIDAVLGTATTEVTAKLEEGIAHVQDNMLSGEAASEFVMLCSQEWFAKLISQAGVKQAFQYYTSSQEPLRDRLPASKYGRTFVFGGVTFREYRGSYNGTRLIPAGEAYLVPVGTMDTFKTFYSPAQKFSLVNTLGEQTYAWTYKDQKDEKIEIESESNFLNLLRRPQVVVQYVTSN